MVAAAALQQQQQRGGAGSAVAAPSALVKFLKDSTAGTVGEAQGRGAGERERATATLGCCGGSSLTAAAAR